MVSRKLDDSTAVSLEPADDVQPVICAAGRELSREFELLQKSLEQRDDWSARCRALKRLQSLVLGSSQVEGFASAVLRMREPLLAQVADLRSALVREACVALRLLAEAFGTGIEGLAVPALAVLLRSTSVTILVIAESCFQCTCAIVRACHAQRIVQALLEPLNARSGVQRQRGLQALLLAVQAHPVTPLERLAEPIQKAIRDGLEDAREEVRAAARQCFWAFAKRFQERGLRFLALLDPARQRQLKADEPPAGATPIGEVRQPQSRARSVSQKRCADAPEALRPPLAEVSASKWQDKRTLSKSASAKHMSDEDQLISESAAKTWKSKTQQRKPSVVDQPSPRNLCHEAKPEVPTLVSAELGPLTPSDLSELTVASRHEPNVNEPPEEAFEIRQMPIQSLVSTSIRCDDHAELLAALQPMEPRARQNASEVLQALHAALAEEAAADTQLAAVQLLERLLHGSELVRDAITKRSVAAPLIAALVRCATTPATSVTRESSCAQRVLRRWFPSEQLRLPTKSTFEPARRGRFARTSEKEATPSLTSLLASRLAIEDQASTLRALAAAAKVDSGDTWLSQGGRVLILVLNALVGSSREVQEASISCLQEMIIHHPACVADFAEVVASKLFGILDRGPDRKLASMVERALDQLLASIDPLRALEILLPQVAKSFTSLAATLRRISPEQILEHLDVIVAPILGAADSDAAETRKAAVFSLVDLYLIVGEDVMTYFRKELSPSQLKLVILYAERQRSESEGHAANS